MSDEIMIDDNEKLEQIYYSACREFPNMKGLRAVAEAAIAADRAARAEPVGWWLHVKRHDAHYFAISEQERKGMEVLADQDDKIVPIYTAPPAAPVVTTEEGRHCGDPDCVPCRDPAEPAAPVVPEDVAKDAERYRWLKSRMIGVDFDWREQGITALSFEMPDGCAFGGNCDQNIDNAMLAAAPAPSQEPTT